MKPYQTEVRMFRTPKGGRVGMRYRLDSSDWNTLTSCLTEDEYKLAGLDLTGSALDIGGHIGGVTLGLLADNPRLVVIAVEPVPANYELLIENLIENGLDNRAIVINGAVGRDEGTTRVHYGYRGSEFAEHHAFIGNIETLQATGPDNCPSEWPHEHAEVPIVTLAGLVDERPFTLMKIDCEGGEWAFLDGATPAQLDRIGRIHGEWHPSGGKHTQAQFSALLPGWKILYIGEHPEGPQGFAAWH